MNEVIGQGMLVAEGILRTLCVVGSWIDACVS